MFEYKEVNGVNYLFSTSFESNIRSARKMKELFEKINLKTGTVIVDLLLANGNSFNRYINVHVNNYMVQRVSIHEEPSKIVKEISLDFYHENINLLKNSILTPFLKKCIELKRII